MKSEVLILTLLLLGFQDIFSQKSESVKIIKTNNDTIDLVYKLRYYKGAYVFPTDSKNFIKGHIKGEKTKIQKSDITKVILNDETEYMVLPVEESYIFGFYVSKGSSNFFKAYPYGHNTIQGLNGPQMTINKIASLAYFTVKENDVKLFRSKKGFKKLSENCVHFKNYLDSKRSINKEKEIEGAMKFYNSNCADH